MFKRKCELKAFCQGMSGGTKMSAGTELERSFISTPWFITSQRVQYFHYAHKHSPSSISNATLQLSLELFLKKAFL